MSDDLSRLPEILATLEEALKGERGGNMTVPIADLRVLLSGGQQLAKRELAIQGLADAYVQRKFEDADVLDRMEDLARRRGLRLMHFEGVMKQIASCDSHVPGDVVSLAQAAVANAPKAE